jgi:predicted RNase H-like nuclease (RuvC/YqgF family)
LSVSFQKYPGTAFKCSLFENLSGLIFDKVAYNGIIPHLQTYFKPFLQILQNQFEKEVMVSMADNFGLKIGLEGEKEFKKALAEINQSFKVLGSEMKVVQSEFDKNDNSVEALTARNQVLNKEIEAQKLTETAAKQEIKAEKAQTNSGYRTKQQRALDAQRRNEISRLEKQINELESRIKEIEQELSMPETFADFKLSGELCAELENIKREHEECLENWLLLCEEADS